MLSQNLFFLLFTTAAFGLNDFSACRGLTLFSNIEPSQLTSPRIPAPIVQSKRESEYPNAIPSFGKLLQPGQKFGESDLKDGHHIYLVLSHGGRECVMWGLRAPGAWAADLSKNLVTHTSLIQKAAESLGAPAAEIQVLAAGEAQIINGVVARVDNRSGTRRGSAEHLAYGIEALMRRGLRIETAEGNSKTQRDDYSGVGPDISFHGEAFEKAERRARVDADPSLSRIRARIVEIHGILYREMPELRDPNIPGYLDPAKTYAANYIDPHGKLTPELRFDFSMFKQAFMQRQIDGADTAAIFFNQTPEDKVMKLLDLGLELHRKNR